MENLFTKIGETILMEIEEIDNVEYLNKELGCYMMITMKNGERYVLSLIDSKN